jgi:hypothetical protein
MPALAPVDKPPGLVFSASLVVVLDAVALVLEEVWELGIELVLELVAELGGSSPKVWARTALSTVSHCY